MSTREMTVEEYHAIWGTVEPVVKDDQYLPDDLVWENGEWKDYEPPVKEPKEDPTSPKHYTRWKIQPLDFIMTNDLPFWLGNVIKYTMRYDLKNGLEDLKKARVYLDKKIDELST